MPYESGSVVLGPDILKLLDPDRSASSLDDIGPRPFVVVSNDRRPFYPDEYTVMAITTTDRDVALPITDRDILDGRLRYDSYINPWTVTPLQSSDIGKRVAQLAEKLVRRAWGDFWLYHGTD